MPRYFFHSGDIAHHADPDGIELPDDAAAQLMALRFAGQLLTSATIEQWQEGRWRVEVTNADGCLKWTVMTLAIDAPQQEPSQPSNVHVLSR